MIKYVHSATILVKDQDQAVDFYVNKLGFEKRRDSPFGENSRWIEVAPPGGQASLALLRPEDVGQGEGGQATPTVGGPTGVSLVVEDIEATYQELAGKGVNFAGPPQEMPWGAKATWMTDQDGNNYFLTEQG